VPACRWSLAAASRDGRGVDPAPEFRKRVRDRSRCGWNRAVPPSHLCDRGVRVALHFGNGSAPDARTPHVRLDPDQGFTRPRASIRGSRWPRRGSVGPGRAARTCQDAGARPMHLRADPAGGALAPRRTRAGLRESTPSAGGRGSRLASEPGPRPARRGGHDPGGERCAGRRGSSLVDLLRPKTPSPPKGGADGRTRSEERIGGGAAGAPARARHVWGAAARRGASDPATRPDSNRRPLPREPVQAECGERNLLSATLAVSRGFTAGAEAHSMRFRGGPRILERARRRGPSRKSGGTGAAAGRR